MMRRALALAGLAASIAAPAFETVVLPWVRDQFAR